MNARTRMALGVAAGYMLGRTKKMRLALMIAAAGATGRSGVSPTKLVQSGLKQLSSSAEVGQLTSLARDELLSAAKSAAVTAASGRIEALSERLQDGGGLTRGKNSRGKADDAPDEEPEDEAEVVDENEDEDQEEPESEPEKPRRRRGSSRKASEGEDEDQSAERPPRRRSSSRRSAASPGDDDEGSSGTRTATRRSPVRRARR
ncbi:hypothetical protein AB0F91_40015 [Amycolatopsis sp. NPDC023774]|uniref:hypothetical protein n=1 Tax=Amycolatopsis sp. NPDC023774 TaxID=3155015 RepID=UPI0034051876